MKKQKLIEKLQSAILMGKKKCQGYDLPKPQKCGTEYQKMTYALIVAQRLVG